MGFQIKKRTVSISGHGFMTRVVVWISLLIFGFSINVYGRLIRPDKGPEAEKLVISGNHRTYYKLDKTEPIVFNLTGPQRIRVITRVVIPANDTIEKYRVEYQIDSQSPRQFEGESGISQIVKHADYPNLQFGVSKSLFITVPEGSHTYKFYPVNTNKNTIYLRVIAAKMEQQNPKAPEMVQLRPEGNAEKTVLQYKDIPLTYYAITNNHTAEVSVNGPTKLEVYSRLQFEYWMEGEVTYRIEVLRDGQIDGTYQLSSERSQTTKYRDDGELVPGKWRRFKMTVPAGRHTYQFRMPDSEYSALIKIELPEDGVGAK